MQVHQFAVNTLYYFSDDETETVRPFLTVGIGGTLYRPTDEAKSIARDPLRGNFAELNESSSLAVNYGFGVKAKAGSRVGFRLDARGFLTRTPSFGLPRDSPDPNALVFPTGGAFHNIEASASIVFYLN